MTLSLWEIKLYGFSEGADTMRLTVEENWSGVKWTEQIRSRRGSPGGEATGSKLGGLGGVGTEKIGRIWVTWYLVHVREDRETSGAILGFPSLIWSLYYRIIVVLGYTVTFTKVPTIYLSQIHPLHHSPLSPLLE
jgi:hypothetical protein